MLGYVEGQIGPDVKSAYEIVDDTGKLVALFVHHSFILAHIVEATVDPHLSHFALEFYVMHHSLIRQVKCFL